MKHETWRSRKHGGLPTEWAGCVDACDASAAGRLRGLSYSQVRSCEMCRLRGHTGQSWSLDHCALCVPCDVPSFCGAASPHVVQFHLCVFFRAFRENGTHPSVVVGTSGGRAQSNVANCATSICTSIVFYLDIELSTETNDRHDAVQHRGTTENDGSAPSSGLTGKDGEGHAHF